MEWSGLKVKDFQLGVCLKGHGSQLTEGSFPSNHPRMSLSPIVPVWYSWGLGQLTLQQHLHHLQWQSGTGGPGERIPAERGLVWIHRVFAPPWPRPGLYIQGKELCGVNDIPNSHPLVGRVVSAVREMSPVKSEGVIMWNYLRFPILIIEIAEWIKYLCPKCHVYKMIISFSIVCTS